MKGIWWIVFAGLVLYVVAYVALGSAIKSLEADGDSALQSFIEGES